jgi:hypothetical protein
LHSQLAGLSSEFRNEHPGTGSGKGFSNALTDAGSGTRHQSGLAIETNHRRTL